MPDASSVDALFIRLYLDHHITDRLAEDLRGLGYDVLTTREAGLEAASDPAQIAFAAAENRAIITFNIRDFAPLHAQWLAEERLHAGIIVSQQLGSRQYGTLLKRMLNLLDLIPADAMQGNLLHLEQFKEQPSLLR